LEDFLRWRGEKEKTRDGCLLGFGLMSPASSVSVDPYRAATSDIAVFSDRCGLLEYGKIVLGPENLPQLEIEDQKLQPRSKLPES